LFLKYYELYEHAWRAKVGKDQDHDGRHAGRSTKQRRSRPKTKERVFARRKVGKRKEKVSQRQADILDNGGDGIMEWNGGRHHHTPAPETS